MDGESAGTREWITVVLSLWSTFLFSSILSGWASIQSFLEDDGVYEDLCSISCKERDSSMISMYAQGQMMSILAYALLNMLSNMGPIFLVTLGGVLETFGLLLLGATDDLFAVAIIFTGVGGSALMVHALKLAFVVSEKHFALVMTLVNCMVDGSSVVPAVLYQLYRFGMSRRQVFFGYGLLCFLLNAFIAFSWLGPSLRRLQARRSEEESDGRRPRLHGVPLPKQLQTFEFVPWANFSLKNLKRSSSSWGLRFRDLHHPGLCCEQLFGLQQESPELFGRWWQCLHKAFLWSTSSLHLLCTSVWHVAESERLCLHFRHHAGFRPPVEQHHLDPQLTCADPRLFGLHQLQGPPLLGLFHIHRA